MKKRILIVAMSGLAATLIGCSSTSLDSNSGQGIAPGSTATTPISEQRLAVSEFKQQGVKVIYNLWGNLEASRHDALCHSYGQGAAELHPRLSIKAL